MKTNIRNLGGITFLSLMLITANATLVAQTAVESTTTKTTTSAGTISEFSPETIVIKTESTLEPIRFSYTKTTAYVDETGAPVSQEVVKSGLPVTVYYVKEGDQMVASKVIVRKTVTEAPESPAMEEEKTSTTTTTTTDK